MDTVRTTGAAGTATGSPSQVSVVVTDSHALIWSITGATRKLGRRARDAFARAERGEVVVYVPVLTLVEIAEATHRGLIQFDVGFTRWAERLLGSGRFLATDLTPAIALKAEELYSIPERGDRLIAATALHLDCPLITNDPALTRVPGLTTIW